MEWTVNGCRIAAKQGDITQQETDAIVNAANKDLAPGGGVAGAIHRAAGQELTEQCREMNRCNTGEAVITSGYDLAATKIIHSVGPIYDAHPNPEELLRESYWNSLELARDNNLGTIAFPLLSTGAFGYPVDEASRVAVETFRDFIRELDDLSEIRMVLFDNAAYETFVKEASDVLE